MTVRREIAQKHVPREAYFARDDKDTHSVLRCTRKSSGSAIAAEMFMNHAGQFENGWFVAYTA